MLFYLNGQRRQVGAEHAHLMLADYLRYVAGLTGTKIVCAEGDCGACTVLRHNPAGRLQSPQFLPVNSCIMPVAQLDGCSIVSVDAISQGDKLSPVQESMRSCHASQCGFCTPGFVMALTGLVEKKLMTKAAGITEQEAKNACTGNLCRCTGYKPIVDSAVKISLSQCQSVSERYFSKKQADELRQVRKTPVLLSNENYEYFAPTSLKQARQYLLKHKDARLLGAATDLGVVHNKGKVRLKRILSLHLIPELYEIQQIKPAKKTAKSKKPKAASESPRISFGARVTFSEARDALKTSFPEASQYLDIFASPQIKNIATLVGNVANASPIADTPPWLLVCDTKVQVFGAKGLRTIPLEEFFVGYRKTALKAGEFILALEFGLPKKDERIALRKISERKDLDISSVNAAFRLVWENKSRRKISNFQMALGGVAATPVRLKKTEAFLKGASLDASTLDRAAALVQTEIEPLSDVRGSAAFRRCLVDGVFRRFFADELPGGLQDGQQYGLQGGLQEELS